jgi:uncharacterized membrane protein
MEKYKIMTQEKFGEKDFQLIIGNLLRYGVWISLSVAFMGGIIYLLNHGNELENYSTFYENDTNIFKVIINIYNGVVQGQGESIILLGIILLFITPILRLLISLIVFYFEKDYLYVFITMIVILIIGTSIFFGFSH